MDILDLVTLDEAKEALNLPTEPSSHDAAIARAVTAVSRVVDVYCGPVVQRSVTEVHDMCGSSRIVLRQHPVVSVTTVNSYSGGVATPHTAETLTTSPSYGYLLDVRLGTVTARSAFGTGYFGGARVEVVYVAGRYAKTGAVDPLFKQASTAILARLWAREAGAWARGADPFSDSGVPGFFKAVEPMVDELLVGHRAAPAVG